MFLLTLEKRLPKVIFLIHYVDLEQSHLNYYVRGMKVTKNIIRKSSGDEIFSKENYDCLMDEGDNEKYLKPYLLRTEDHEKYLGFFNEVSSFPSDEKQ